MKNYIILRNGVQEHYFSDSAIYSHTLKNGFFTPSRLIKKDTKKDFGLFADDNENVHIISADRKNNITYTLIKDEEVLHHTILSVKQNVIVSDFGITMQNGILNLFYTAKIGEEIFLIHCVLGDNAMPSVISKTADSNYFSHEGRIYFSNEQATLGYCDFSDSKPSDFVPLFKNSISPYIDGSGQTRHMVWKCGNDIILDGTPVISDKAAAMPIIISEKNPVLMWISNDIVHYTPVSSEISPMRFISAGKVPELFCVQSGDILRYFYGTYSDSRLNIFGKSDIFENTTEHDCSKDDMQRMKITLGMMQREIDELRKQLDALKSKGK